MTSVYIYIYIYIIEVPSHGLLAHHPIEVGPAPEQLAARSIIIIIMLMIVDNTCV